MMASSDDSISLSPAVVQVVDQFVTAMRADEQVPNYFIDRLDATLRQGTVPKPDQLTILFTPPEEKPNKDAAEADTGGGQP